MKSCPELARMLRYLYEALSERDIARIEAFHSCKAPSVTDESQDLWSLTKVLAPDVSAPIEWKAGAVQAHREATVGWTIDQPTVSLPVGCTLKPRLTLVWRKEDATWKVVHAHVSVEEP